MCCTRLAEKTGCKNSPSEHHCTTSLGYIYATKACIENQNKKLLTAISPSHVLTCGELPTSGSDQLAGLGHPRKFQRVSCLGFITAPTLLNRGQPNLARCSAISSAGTLYTFSGALVRILSGAKFTLRPKLAFSYFGSVTARHLSIWRQPNFMAFSRGCHRYLPGWPSRCASAHILVRKQKGANNMHV